jgi:preprotein translocase subunit SecE
VPFKQAGQQWRPETGNRMNAKVEQSAQAASPGDIVKYVLAGLIAVAGVVGFYWFAEWPGPLRGLLPVLAVIVAGIVCLPTAKGRQAREFLSETRFELRKVVWPTRQETLRSTGVILVVVIIISLLIALIDFFISSFIGWLLG